jgi:hypothetical protein
VATRTVTTTSRLAAKAADVWTHATMLASVNREMGPWLYMTSPAEVRGLSLASPLVVLGEPLFTSWVLALRIFPVERMRVTIAELEPGRRFVERSRVLVMRAWRHERTVEPAGPEACVVTDTITVEPRLGIAAPFVGAFLRWFFAHRHRRLRALFGETK